MFTYWPLRIAISRRITWITALSALAAALAVVGLARLGSSPAALSTSSVVPSSVGSAGPGLFALASEHPAQRVHVIVQFTGGTSAATQRTLVTAAAGQVTRDLHIINGLGVRMTAAAARTLAADPRVHAVSLDAQVRSSGNSSSLSSNVQQNFIASTGTDSAWSNGATGAGVGVAVIDTGVAGDLLDFQNSQSDSTSRVVVAAALNPGASDPYDEYGHGTHVAGLIAGNGTNRSTGDPQYGQYMGTAPNANLVDVKVSDDGGNTTLIDVIYGLQFAVDHQADYNIRVVNLSLDSTVAQSYTTDPLDAAAEAAWNNGIVVLAAAGNMGSASDAVSYAPANDPYVLTIGAVDDTQSAKPRTAQLTTWSSRGLTQDGFAKPEVTAPGAHMISTLAPNSLFAQLCPGCVVGGGSYFQISGTSMSAAVASGIVADLAGFHPTWTPDQIKSAIVNTASRTSNRQAVEVNANSALYPGSYNLNHDVNAGLTPSTLIDPTTGNIDYARASWTRASWTRASWTRASWSRASWSCVCDPTGGSADPSRASWSRASWSRASWSRASWSSYLDPVSSSDASSSVVASSTRQGAIHARYELEGSRWDLKYHSVKRHAGRRAHRGRARAS